MEETVEIPFSLLTKMAEASEAFQAFEDELEDFLISHDQAILDQLNKAHNSRLRGDLRPFSEIRGGE